MQLEAQHRQKNMTDEDTITQVRKWILFTKTAAKENVVKFKNPPDKTALNRATHRLKLLLQKIKTETLKYFLKNLSPHNSVALFTLKQPKNWNDHFFLAHL